ncbi:MAG: outer membrane beta-barrel protein [Bacteroides sp.]|nr:outer membrane beta-barrel protein [Bacteroides sp.]MCM1414007.1 outer membrane beta-barrel protein [Bacteroides sp.]MCM1472298.1 outer membrane beta-barrel protein [Bacteroides sp.]
MKRIIIALIAVLGISYGASARKMNLSLSYGGYTLMDAADYHDGWHGVNNAWGAINLAYNVEVARNFWIGPSYTFSSTTTKGPESSKIAYHAIMLNGRYDYYRNSLLTVYGHMGIGAEISHMQPRGGDSYNKGYFAFQLSPVGVDVDLSPMFTIFGEAGFGVQGLIQVGARLNF